MYYNSYEQSFFCLYPESVHDPPRKEKPGTGADLAYFPVDGKPVFNYNVDCGRGVLARRTYGSKSKEEKT